MKGTALNETSERNVYSTEIICRRIKLWILQVYCPTANNKDGEVKVLYNNLFILINMKEMKCTITVEDFDKEVD